MNVLSRYLFRNFFIILALVYPGLIGFYLVVEVFERLDDFVEANAPMSSAIAYFLLSVPRIFYELGPMALLLAGLLSLMLLSRHKEILAMRSLGVRPFKIILPFFIAGSFLSAAMVFFQAFYIPKAIVTAGNIWQVEVKKKVPRGMLQGNRLFYLGNKSIWTTRLGRPDAKKLEDVQWFSFDRDYKIIQLVTASEAIYSGGRWIFRHGLRKLRATGEFGPLVEKFKSLSLDIAEVPEDFVAIKTPTEEMDMISLWRSIWRSRHSGRAASEQETMLWGRILYPFLGCSLLFVGLSLTLCRERGGLAMGFGLGLIIGFAAWITWNFALTLGKSGRVPAFFALGMVHIVLIGTGLVLMRRLRF